MHHVTALIAKSDRWRREPASSTTQLYVPWSRAFHSCQLQRLLQKNLLSISRELRRPSLSQYRAFQMGCMPSLLKFPTTPPLPISLLLILAGGASKRRSSGTKAAYASRRPHQATIKTGLTHPSAKPLE